MQYKRAHTLQEATKKMERFCSYQERCHSEVISKLRDLRMIPEAVDLIVAHLIEHDFLNEERFARSYARGKFNTKKWGRNRLVAELKKRGISKYNIQIALQEINEDHYLDTLDGLIKKRMLQLANEAPLKKKRKVLDYLLYRGWEMELVYEKVHELFVKSKT